MKIIKKTSFFVLAIGFLLCYFNINCMQQQQNNERVIIRVTDNQLMDVLVAPIQTISHTRLLLKSIENCCHKTACASVIIGFTVMGILASLKYLHS